MRVRGKQKGQAARLAKVILVSGLLAGGLSAHAESGGPAPVPGFDAFQQILTAKSVADYGRRQHDPLALLTAARLLREVPFQDDPKADATGAAFTPQGLLDEARAMAADKPALLAQLTLPKQTRSIVASPFGKGLVRTLHDVGAHTNYGFAAQAKAGELLRVGAIGDVRTQMVIKVSDSHGKTLCMDDNRDYAPVCSVTPQSGDIRVEIANNSDYLTKAVILSN